MKQKKWLFILFTGALLLLSACDRGPTLTTLSGKQQPLSHFRGKWVFINYWATWCKPCVKEVPMLNQLIKDHKNLRIFGVNFDEKRPSAIRANAKKLGIRFPLLLNNPAPALGIDSLSVLPTTLVISPGGKLIKTLQGEQTKSSLEALMDP